MREYKCKSRSGYVLIKIGALLALMLAAALIAAVPASAAERITETVSLANARKNERGPGYFWDNINDTLTLNGLNIETDDEYGLKLPDNATVILVGDNKITASKVALLTTGTTIFKGNGTLTLTAGEAGIMLADPTTLGKVSFLSGRYKINSRGDGIYSDKVRLYIAGGEFDISSDGYAIKGPTVEINDAKVKAKGAIYSFEPLVINNAELEATSISSDDALQTGKEFRFSNIKLYAGANSGSAAEVPDRAYSGGAFVKTTPTYVERKYSVVFGGNVPAWVDYVVFLGAGAGIAATIAVPLLIKRKKYLKRLEQLKAAKQ